MIDENKEELSKERASGKGKTRIRIEATWNKTNEISIDWVPKLTFRDNKYETDKTYEIEKPEWAWWNFSLPVSSCYQETATSTTCGNTAGTYSCTGSWDGTYTCANTYDANTATYGKSPDATVTEGIITINYTKVSAATGAILQYKVQGSETNVTIPASCFNRTGTNNITIKGTTGLSAGLLQYVNLKCRNDTSDVTLYSAGPGGSNWYIYEEGMWWTFNDTRGINITFSSSTNYTITYPNGAESGTGTSWVRNSTQIGNGTVIIAFGSSQKIEFTYDTSQSIANILYVFTLTPDKNQKINVWDGYSGINDAFIEIYKVTSSGEQLAYSTYTDTDGNSYATLQSGNSYKFIITATGYGIANETRYIIPTVDDTQRFTLTSTSITTNTAYLIDNCSKILNTTSLCNQTLLLNYYPTNITFANFINRTTWINTTNTTSAKYYNQLLSMTTARPNVTTYIYINGVLWKATEHLYVSNYTGIYVPNPLLPTGSEEQTEFVIFALLIAGAFAAVANRLILGSGIYTFAMTFALLGAAVQFMWIPVVMVSIVIVKRVAERILGG